MSAIETLPHQNKRPLLPGMVVLGLAVVVLGFFGTFSLIFGNSSVPPPLRTLNNGVIPGTHLRAEGAESLFQPIEQAGTPPSDVLQSLYLPLHSHYESRTAPTSNTDQYDATITFSCPCSEQTLITFFHYVLKKAPWSFLSQGPATNKHTSTQLLSQISSSDGWYWEVGAIISPTQFVGKKQLDKTTFSVRIYEVPDSF
jgi:hypothetical protein